MGDTAKQVEHDVKGAAEKAAGAVTGSDRLQEKGDEHLEKAAELDELHDSGQVGVSKGEGSDGQELYSWKDEE